MPRSSCSPYFALSRRPCACSPTDALMTLCCYSPSCTLDVTRFTQVTNASPKAVAAPRRARIGKTHIEQKKSARCPQGPTCERTWISEAQGQYPRGVNTLLRRQSRLTTRTSLVATYTDMRTSLLAAGRSSTLMDPLGPPPGLLGNSQPLVGGWCSEPNSSGGGGCSENPESCDNAREDEVSGEFARLQPPSRHRACHFMTASVVAWPGLQGRHACK